MTEQTVDAKEQAASAEPASPSSAAAPPAPPPIDSRYDGRPLLVVIENYILSAIGELDEARTTQTAALVLRSFGNGEDNQDWRDVFRQVIGVTPELDDELQGMWQRNQQVAEEEQVELTAMMFAMMVADDNFSMLID